MQAHFAVSAWFYSSVRVRQQGMLPLQDGSHKDCLLFVPQTTMRQSYDIFAKRQREWGKIFLREVGEEMLKQRGVIETRWITNAAISAISAILQFCNFCNLHYSV